tara:strand:- start:1709 stop:2233 length:525 start_codon:yes stop_codon:yes gene_type:complete
MLTNDIATIKQLKDLVPIYKKAFKKHNIFKQSDKEIFAYLKETHQKYLPFGGGYIVSMIDDPLMKIKDKVIGAILVAFKGIDAKKHMRIELKHLAVEPKYQSIGAATDLINISLDKLYFAIRNENASSAKIEVRVSDNEKSLKLFKKLGFKEEGKLKDHYRLGESCHILGFLIK